jgi:replication initiation and membrane attachment protein
MSINVLPADTYVVINKTILNDGDRKLLTTLYQPIVGSTAISLYFTLWSYLDNQEVLSNEWTHHHLMTSMQLKLEDIIEAREKLEAIGLLKSYYYANHVNHYAYVLYSPLPVAEFFKNPILSTSLYSNVGMSEYKNIIEYFKIPAMDLSKYTEVTAKFDQVFESVPATSLDHLIDDLKHKSTNGLEFTAKIDLNNILELIPEDILNHNITVATKDLLYKLSYIYNLDDDEMGELIRNSINERHMIDKDLIRRNATNYYQFENSGKLPTLVYRNQPEYLRKPLGDSSRKAQVIYQFETTSPYDFLISKSGGTNLTKNDKDVLAMLALDFDLKPGVINVLLDYVLKINNNKLTKAFIETIATQWKRSKIETVEDAMDIAEKEYKSRKGVTKKDTNMTKPVWFDKDITSEKASDSEQAEIDKMLDDIK